MDPGRNPEADEGEKASFLPHTPRDSEGNAGSPADKRVTRRRTTWWYLRLLIDIGMAITIVLLLLSRTPARDDRLRRTPVPRFPRKMYTFRNDPKYVDGKMFFNETETLRTLHNWVELSPGSRGYVVVGDGRGFDLPEPYEVAVDRDHNGPGYMVTAFHQLHCLSYLAEHYQLGYGGAQLTGEVAHHSAHCFDYLRQGIMCSADTTLEGKTEAGPGEGSEHECTDYDALLEWANAKSAWKWRGNVPGDTIL